MSSTNGGPNGIAQHDGIDLEKADTRSDIHQEQLRNMLTNTMTMTPEMFERMYLNPKNDVKGDLRKTFANPTPLALLGFSVGLFPLSAAFMGWRGAGGFAVASTTASIWFGGVLLILAGIGEFLLGNTFPFVVFMGYGAHFLTFATTFIPAFNAIGFFGPGAESDPMSGQTVEFAASFGFYPVALAILSFIFLIGSIRTNVVFVIIFVFATLGFSFGGGAYWQIAKGNMELGMKLTVALGACFFGACMCGWYLLLAVMIATMELPIPDLPVGDLSNVIKARSRTVKSEKQR